MIDRQIIVAVAFLILCGILLILYAVCCVAGQCDDEEGGR